MKKIILLALILQANSLYAADADSDNRIATENIVVAQNHDESASASAVVKEQKKQSSYKRSFTSRRSHQSRQAVDQSAQVADSKAIQQKRTAIKRLNRRFVSKRAHQPYPKN